MKYRNRRCYRIQSSSTEHKELYDGATELQAETENLDINQPTTILQVK